MIGIGSNDYEQLFAASASSPRLRSHQNIHSSESDACQKMLVGIQPGSYIRPHQHLIVPKSETIFCLAGNLGVITFDDEGAIKEKLLLSPDGIHQGTKILPGEWHMLICLAENTVFLETKAGPYTPFVDADFASWAPADLFEEFLNQKRAEFTSTIQ